MSIFSEIGKLFGSNQKNPADVANKRLGQIPGAMHPYYQNYMNAGNQEINKLMPIYEKLMSNPGEFFKGISENYQESPGYQHRLMEALHAGNNAAAAGGMLGSGANQYSNMQTASDFASDDYEKYLSHIMEMFGKGISGAEGINKMGYDASRDYATSLGNTLGQQASYDYAGQAGKNQNNWGSIFGPLASLASAPMTGGGSLAGYGLSKLFGIGQGGQ